MKVNVRKIWILFAALIISLTALLAGCYDSSSFVRESSSSESSISSISSTSSVSSTPSSKESSSSIVESVPSTAVSSASASEAASIHVSPPSSKSASKPPQSSRVSKPPQSSSSVSSKAASRGVFYTRTGKKYHYKNPCGNGTYYPCTLNEAKAKGLEPCEKCVL